MSLSYIITESNALRTPHFGLRQISAGVDVSNKKRDDTGRQRGIVRRATDQDKVVLSCDQKTTSKSYSLIPVNQLSGKGAVKNSLPATQMQVNETLGVTGTGYALNIHTHFLNNQCVSGTAVTETMGRAVDKYKESQAFSSQPTSTFELNV